MDVSTMVIVAVLAVLYLTFLLWYGGRGKPLAPDEVEDLLRQMRRRAGRDDSTEQAEPAMLRHFRDLAGSDDGSEFWMLNLQAFRERAKYPPDLAAEFGDDPMAANSRYNRAIIPQLLRRGSHPVFATVVAGHFINEGDDPVWDQVAAVRYRSRRDLLRMAVGIAGTGIDVHKWAALERTQVFPVRPYLSLTLVRTSVAAVFLVVGGVLAMMTG
jgi:hypothetical protein